MQKIHMQCVFYYSVGYHFTFLIHNGHSIFTTWSTLHTLNGVLCCCLLHSAYHTISYMAYKCITSNTHNGIIFSLSDGFVPWMHHNIQHNLACILLRHLSGCIDNLHIEKDAQRFLFGRLVIMKNKNDEENNGVIQNANKECNSISSFVNEWLKCKQWHCFCNHLKVTHQI